MTNFNIPQETFNNILEYLSDVDFFVFEIADSLKMEKGADYIADEDFVEAHIIVNQYIETLKTYTKGFFENHIKE